MDLPRSEPAGTRFDELHAEAAEALAFAANTLRAVRDRYRGTYLDDLSRWQALADDLGALERAGGVRCEASPGSPLGTRPTCRTRRQRPPRRPAPRTPGCG